MKSKGVTELLRLIEAEKRVQLTKDSLVDPVPKIYSLLRTLFQAHKKSHQHQLMQDRVYTINIPQTDLITANKKVQQNRDAVVSAAVLCDKREMEQSDISNLILLREFLERAKKKELFQEILKQIQNLKSVAQVLNCFKRILRSAECLADSKLYGNTQVKMIEKVLSMPLVSSDFPLIANFIITLPAINADIVAFMSRLFHQATHLADYHQIYHLFINNFPTTPSSTDLEGLTRINTPQTLPKIKLFMGQYPQMAAIVEQEAKLKLTQMAADQSSADTQLTDKVQSVLNFIVLAVRSGSSIWKEIMEWEHRVAQSWRECLKQKLEQTLILLLREESSFNTVLLIVSRMMDIEDHSEIGLIFVREMLRIEDRNYLNHRQIRRFLANNILKYSTEELVRMVFGDLRFVEVVFEMFTFEDNCVRFYKNMLANQESFRLLRDYFGALSIGHPVKFKDFFIRLDQTGSGEIFNSHNNPLIKLFGEAIPFELAVNLIRDLALYPPSKFVAAIFIKFFLVFQKHEQLGTLKKQVIRCLNLMLIRTPTAKLNDHFKNYLPKLIQTHLLEESKLVFEHVSQETCAELKRAFDQGSKKK